MVRLLLIATLLISSTTRAEVALSTISDLEQGGICFGDQPDVGTAPNWAAVGFTTASVEAGIDSVRVRLNDQSSGGAFTATLHSGSDNAVGSAITEIGAGVGTMEGAQTTFDIYTLTPSSRIPLSSNTNYWIVMTSSVSASCAMSVSAGGLDSAGSLFTYLGTRNRYDETIYDNSSAGVLQFEISVTRDSDGDGVYDAEDAYPNDPSKWAAPVPGMPAMLLFLLAGLLGLLGVRRLKA